MNEIVAEGEKVLVGVAPPRPPPPPPPPPLLCICGASLRLPRAERLRPTKLSNRSKMSCRCERMYGQQPLPSTPQLFLTLLRCIIADAPFHPTQESFDPIIDVTTKQDLLPKMIQAQPLGDFDFQGMFSVLLKHRCE